MNTPEMDAFEADQKKLTCRECNREEMIFDPDICHGCYSAMYADARRWRYVRRTLISFGDIWFSRVSEDAIDRRADELIAREEADDAGQ